MEAAAAQAEAAAQEESTNQTEQTNQEKQNENSEQVKEIEKPSENKQTEQNEVAQNTNDLEKVEPVVEIKQQEETTENSQLQLNVPDDVIPLEELPAPLNNLVEPPVAEFGAVTVNTENITQEQAESPLAAIPNPVDDSILGFLGEQPVATVPNQTNTNAQNDKNKFSYLISNLSATVVTPPVANFTGRGQDIFVERDESYVTLYLYYADGTEMTHRKQSSNGGTVFSFNPPMTNGEKYYISAMDKDGNMSELVEVIAPDLTPPETPENLSISNDGLVLTGTTKEPGEISVTDSKGNKIGYASVDDKLNFSVIFNDSLNYGVEITVVLTDVNGKQGNSVKYVVADKEAPEAPDASSNPDGWKITGKAEPGAEIEVKGPSGEVIGTGKVEWDGEFKVTLNTAQKNGEKLEVTATDAANNKSLPGKVEAGDTTAPLKLTGELDANGKFLNGDTEAGARVVVKDKYGKIIGEGTAEANGS